jgi:hypothetical protein
VGNSALIIVELGSRRVWPVNRECVFSYAPDPTSGVARGPCKPDMYCSMDCFNYLIWTLIVAADFFRLPGLMNWFWMRVVPFIESIHNDFDWWFWGLEWCNRSTGDVYSSWAPGLTSGMSKFGRLLYLAALAQRTLCAKISCVLKVFSLRFEDMLLSKCANINLRQCLHSGVCAKISMRQIFSFYSICPLLKSMMLCTVYRSL